MTDHLVHSPQAAAYSANYTYSLADYRALIQAQRRLNPIRQALWRWRYLWIMALPLAAVVYTGLGRLTLEDYTSWKLLSRLGPIFAALLLLMVLVDILFDRIFVSWVFRRYAIANKSVAIVFHDNGLSWSSEAMKGEFSWNAITRILTLKNYLFLFISKAEAICIPRRAFASEDAFNDLAKYAKERTYGQTL